MRILKMVVLSVMLINVAQAVPTRVGPCKKMSPVNTKAHLLNVELFSGSYTPYFFKMTECVRTGLFTYEIVTKDHVVDLEWYEDNDLPGQLLSERLEDRCIAVRGEFESEKVSNEKTPCILNIIPH